jgi:hypothetical protein
MDWASRPIAGNGLLCITEQMGEDVEPHAYRLGSPLASIVGMAERTLQRTDLDDDVRADLRAIRDLALAALEAEERRGGGAPAS